MMSKDGELKQCSCCKQLLSIDSFHKDKRKKDGLHVHCKKCRKDKQAIYRQTPQYKIARNEYYESAKYKKQTRMYKLKKYGLTINEHYQLWVEQNGRCAVCKQPLAYEDVHTDHNHITGQVRGLTCMGCNLLLGYAHTDELGVENLQKAIDYIQRHK